MYFSESFGACGFLEAQMTPSLETLQTLKGPGPPVWRNVHCCTAPFNSPRKLSFGMLWRLKKSFLGCCSYFVWVLLHEEYVKRHRLIGSWKETQTKYKCLLGTFLRIINLYTCKVSGQHMDGEKCRLVPIFYHCVLTRQHQVKAMQNT